MEVGGLSIRLRIRGPHHPCGKALGDHCSGPDGKGDVGIPEDCLYAVLLVKETRPLPEHLPHFAFPLGRCWKLRCFIEHIGRMDFFLNVFELAG